MNKHPEQRDGEIYMGNTTGNEFMKCAWVSKRLGAVALDASGSVIPKDGYGYGQLLPWFIQRSEIEQTIRAAELLNRPWSVGKIRDLAPMLSEDWTPCEEYRPGKRIIQHATGAGARTSTPTPVGAPRTPDFQILHAKLPSGKWCSCASETFSDVIISRAICGYCNSQFGFGVPIYRDPLDDGRMTAHLSCAIARAEVRAWTPEHFAAPWHDANASANVNADADASINARARAPMPLNACSLQSLVMPCHARTCWRSPSSIAIRAWSSWTTACPLGASCAMWCSMLRSSVR